LRKPGVLTRAKAAYKFYRDGWQQFGIVPRERGRGVLAINTWGTKAAPFIWPEWRMGQPIWQLVDYPTYAQEGYNENTVVYSAIMYKVRSIVSAPLRAYTGTLDEPELLPPDHPLSQLVARPNRFMSWPEFQGLAEVYFNLSGNCYIYVDKGTPALYLLRPDLVKIVPRPGKKELMGFLYVPEGKGQADGIPYLPQDIIHVKLPNPLDELDGLGYGIPPVSPAARSVDVDNQVTRFLKLFFDKGAMPPGLLSYDYELDDEDIARARERWQEQYGGVANWTDVAVLDKTGKYQRLGLTFDEMGFEGLDERNEARISGPFGVPPILIGARAGLKHATYCLPAMARISTPGGLKHIANIEPGDRVWSFVDGELQEKSVIWSGQVGKKKLYEIRTKNRTLRATGNHPVLVRTPGKKGGVPNHLRHAGYEWRRVDELTTDDWVVEPKAYPDCNIQFAFTPDHYRFFGAIIGDGTVDAGRGQVRMAIPRSDDCHDEYVALAQKLFTKDNGGPIRVAECPRSFNFVATKWTRRLVELGLGDRAHTKRIPGWVYQLSRVERLAFLAGLIDTDGSIDKRGALTIGFTSEELTHDVRHLFLTTGFQCTNVYRRVTTPDMLPSPGTKDQYDFYRFVVSSAAMLAEIPFTNSTYRHRVEGNSHRIRDCGKDAVRAGLDNHLGFYRVKEIIELEPESVYDITVEGGHSFVADGVVVHNSNYEEARRAFWQDTLVPELRWFEMEYQYYLQGDKGEFVMFDLSKVPALEPPAKERADIARDAFRASGITRNEYRSIIGLDPDPDGDVYLVSLGVIEVPASQQGEETEEGAPEAEEQAAQVGLKSGVGIREVLAIVHEAGRQALKKRKMVSWPDVLPQVQEHLDNEAIRTVFRQATEEGWSVEAMTNKLRKVLA